MKGLGRAIGVQNIAEVPAKRRIEVCLHNSRSGPRRDETPSIPGPQNGPAWGALVARHSRTSSSLNGHPRRRRPPRTSRCRSLQSEESGVNPSSSSWGARTLKPSHWPTHTPRWHRKMLRKPTPPSHRSLSSSGKGVDTVLTHHRVLFARSLKGPFSVHT